jgi:hypothetical protein
MAIGNYLKFNNTIFPNPVSATMTSKTLENVTVSEAGSDLVVMVRPSKKAWSLSFNLTSRTKDILKALCLEESVSMEYMGTNYTVRVRDYNESLVQNSEWIERTDGLFECSVKVTEY